MSFSLLFIYFVSFVFWTRKFNMLIYSLLQNNRLNFLEARTKRNIILFVLSRFIHRTELSKTIFPWI